MTKRNTATNLPNTGNSSIANVEGQCTSQHHIFMTDTDKVSLYTKVLDTWGVDSQIKMVMEESGEMLAALGKAVRGRVTKMDVITELADVSIMMEQMAVLFGLDEFRAEKERKLQRLQQRLKEWEE